VYSEAGGIVGALESMSRTDAQNTLFIDSTTLDVEVARNVAKEVSRIGAQIVDAPVSGGVAGAKAGTLAFLVGGTPTAFKLAQPGTYGKTNYPLWPSRSRSRGKDMQ